MRNRGQLRPASPAPFADVANVAPAWTLSRWFYRRIGRDWAWDDRLGWTDEQWRSWVERPGYEMWVARRGGAHAGYLDLDADPTGNVEVAYFGLLPQFVGRGLGGHLLPLGVNAAWEGRASRVWVHTCSLDAPHAGRNYEVRGFSIYDRTIEEGGSGAPCNGGRESAVVDS